MRKKLQNAENKLYKIRNGLIYRQRDGDTLFYVPEGIVSDVIKTYHDEMGHFGPTNKWESQNLYR